MHDENLQLMFPVSLIKKEERIVVGVATSDNVDKSGDVVGFDASIEAFKNWQGNIREMHQPLAVGKAVGHRSVDINHDGQNFKGIEVSAYISKGAEDTWEKVLDGTLSAFSIGGRVLERVEDETKSFRGQPVSVITKYELGELSLVDNPANPAANITLVKAEGGALEYALDVVDGECYEIGDTTVCITDAKSEDTSGECQCKTEDSSEMESNITEELQNKDISATIQGMDNVKEDTVVETTASEDVVVDDVVSKEQESNENEKISLLQRFLTWLNDVSDEDLISASMVVDVDVEKSAEAQSKFELKVDDIDEGDDMNIDELTSALGVVMDEKLASFAETSKENVETLIEEKLAAAIETVSKSQTDLEEKIEETAKSVTERMDGVDTRVETVENAGAIKKSVDESEVDAEEEVVEKAAEEETSIWGNLFLPQNLIKSLGYKS
jgi:hypothetical protein